MLLLVQLPPFKFILFVDITDLKNRTCTQKCATLINYAVKKEAGYIFDFNLTVKICISYFPCVSCHHSFSFCKFFNSLSLFLSCFLPFWPNNSWITILPLVIVFKLMCFTHTFHRYIHQEKITSASKNRLSNLLMHVWKIQKVWDEYKNNLKQKAEEWKERKYT